MKKYEWYVIKDCLDNEMHIAQYLGRTQEFECCVCGKGHNAFGFNVYYDEDGYETWCYGKEHLPQIIKKLGKSETTILDEDVEKYL